MVLLLPPLSGRNVVVLAKDANRAGLRPFLTLLLDECDRRPHRQVIERVVQHARVVEVDTLFTRLNEPVSVHFRELDDFTVRSDVVRLDVPRCSRAKSSSRRLAASNASWMATLA